jgi:predicted small secreted protein
MKAIIAIMLGAFILTACNTMDGFGRDVQSGGKKIQHEADEHR